MTQQFRSSATAMSRGEPRAHGAPARPKTDRFLRFLGRNAMAVFYREIEIIGLDNFPNSGSAIVVGNHNNSLIDGVLMVSNLPRMPRFLAASTVWDYPLVVPFLNAAGVVPLFRRQDGRENDGDTAQSLSAAAHLLGAGGVLAVFPEGKSHNEAALLPMKSGTARIALQAERDHGPLDLKIIPVGLTFESKNVFRSRVLFEVGEAVTVAHDTSKPAARALTDRISTGLSAITPNYDSWEDARVLEHAADMWLHMHAETPETMALPDQPSLTATANMRKTFRQEYATLRRAHPDQIETARSAVGAYMDRLHHLGLRDDQVGTAQGHGALLRAALRALGNMALRLPVTLVGLLFNAVPFYALFWLSRQQDLDKRATWSVFAGLVMFPVFWTIVAAVIGYWVTAHYGGANGVLSVLCVFVLAPLTGLAVIKSGEKRKNAIQNLRAWYVLRKSGRNIQSLRDQRASAQAHLYALWDRVRARET